MTVSTTISKVIYIGTASVSVYAYTFRIFANTDLVVTEVLIATGVETVLTLTTDYTVSGAGDATGGNVTLVAGNLPATKKLVIQRTLPQTQAFDLVENDNAPSLGYENAYDKLTMIVQELQTTLDSAIKLPLSLSGVSSFLPEPEADKVLVWASDGLSLTNQTLTQTDTGAIADGAVTTPKLANLAVTAVKMASDAVETAKIKDLNVTTAKLALLAVDTAQLAAVSVTTAKLALLAVDTAQLAADAVDGDKIEDDAVDSEHIAAAAIDLEHLSAIVAGGVAQGWIKLDGTGTVAILDSFNVDSITDNGTGDYTVTWDVDFADTNYSCVSVNGTAIGNTIDQYATGSVVVNTHDANGAQQDTDNVCCHAFGNQ